MDPHCIVTAEELQGRRFLERAAKLRVTGLQARPTARFLVELEV